MKIKISDLNQNQINELYQNTEVMNSKYTLFRNMVASIIEIDGQDYIYCFTDVNQDAYEQFEIDPYSEDAEKDLISIVTSEFNLEDYQELNEY